MDRERKARRVFTAWLAALLLWLAALLWMWHAGRG